jgi:hypothetical protein
VQRRVDAPPVVAEGLRDLIPPEATSEEEAPAPLIAELVAETTEAPEALPEEAAPDYCCAFTESLRQPAPPRVIIKTNLLYDVALTPNLGVEVPLGEHFSIGAEFMRGWWLTSDWSFCWQLEAATLEGRYWWRSPMQRHLHGGWFVGVFAQAGFYDFQLNAGNGIQGEYLTAGLSGGYLYPLSTHWSIEFTLGIGYLLSDYRRYDVAPIHDGHELVASEPAMRFKGLPYPVKAGIAIQWSINWGKRSEVQ